MSLRGRSSAGGGARAIVSGTPAPGNTLTASAILPPGSTVTAYQWQRDGANISGQTAATYVVQSGDLGHAIGCRVTATVPVTGVVTVSSPTVPIGTLYVSGAPLMINGAYLRLA